MPLLVEPIAGILSDPEAEQLTDASGFTDTAVRTMGHVIEIVAAALFFPLAILAVGLPIAAIVRLVAEVVALLAGFR